MRPGAAPTVGLSQLRSPEHREPHYLKWAANRPALCSAGDAHSVRIDPHRPALLLRASVSASRGRALYRHPRTGLPPLGAVQERGPAEPRPQRRYTRRKTDVTAKKCFLTKYQRKCVNLKEINSLHCRHHLHTDAIPAVTVLLWFNRTIITLGSDSGPRAAPGTTVTRLTSAHTVAVDACPPVGPHTPRVVSRGCADRTQQGTHSSHRSRL